MKYGKLYLDGKPICEISDWSISRHELKPLHLDGVHIADVGRWQIDIESEHEGVKTGTFTASVVNVNVEALYPDSGDSLLVDEEEAEKVAKYIMSRHDSDSVAFWVKTLHDHREATK